MLMNYLKIALRNLKKHKGYSLINISGLSIGMACFILIALWVQDELSYDRFHKEGDNLYRVILEHHFAGGNVLTTKASPPPLAAALVEEVPEITNATRYLTNIRKYRMAHESSCFNERRLSLADTAFLNMFSFTFIHGDPSTALSEPYSMVITESIADKYFGEEDPIGKSINMDKKWDFNITGVIEDISHRSHFQFDFLVPFYNIRDLRPDSRLDVYWNNITETFVLCQDKVSLEMLNGKIKGFIKAHYEDATADILLQPLRNIHLYSLTGKGGAIQYVRHFSIIALFVLLIGCINFMNLSTARSARRAKEVGLRKVVGANRRQLVKQFLGESGIYSLISIIVAVALVELLLPVFNRFSLKNMSLAITNLRHVLGLLSITVVTGILSGCYPALFLSSFKPASVLKGTLRAGKMSSSLRRILVIVQFSISIILIVCTISVFRQLAFIQNKDLGFNRDRLLYMEIRDDFASSYEKLKNALLKNPNVLNITAANTIPANIRSSTSGIGWDGKDPNDVINMNHIHVDFDFLETFQMRMLQGRMFSKKFATDSSNYILNETAVRFMGKHNAVGERFNLWGRDGKIIGVVKDFHFSHFSNEINPLIIAITPSMFTRVILRIRSENMAQTIRDIESAWSRAVPGYPFEYLFFNEDFDRLYQSEQRMGKLFLYFTLLAIFISCIGLFSLASFMTEQRTKEIGIRKVLGATVNGLVFLLSREFLKWVVLANFFAWPISYFIMNLWLQNFVYRVHMALWPFLLSGFLAVSIAFLTVSVQSIKAALTNPAEALKYE